MRTSRKPRRTSRKRVARNPYYHATRGDFAKQILESGKLLARPAYKYKGRPAVFAGDTRSATIGDQAMDWADSKHSVYFGAFPEEENVLIEFDAREPDDRRGPEGHEAVWFSDVELINPRIVRRRTGRMLWNGRRTSRRKKPSRKASPRKTSKKKTSSRKPVRRVSSGVARKPAKSSEATAIADTQRLLRRWMVPRAYAVKFSDAQTSAMGKVNYRSRTISYSRPLWERATPTQRAEVVIHEVAHAVVEAFQGRTFGVQHGEAWKKQMRAMGIRQPSAYHTVSREGLKRTRADTIDVLCCGTAFRMTVKKATQLSSLRCRGCKEPPRIPSAADRKRVEGYRTRPSRWR